MFHTIPKTEIYILATLNLSSANAFNLVQSKNFRSVKIEIISNDKKAISILLSLSLFSAML